MGRIIAAISLSLFFFACAEQPDPALEKKYQETADQFCQAIVECLKEDLSEKLKDQPRKRDLFLQRMDQDLCRKGQYQKARGLQEQMDEGTILERYRSCTDALKASESCKSRLSLLKENPDCRSIHTTPEFP
ncbi:MAG: hypothetical protein KDK23_16320 [Leptospiraceae bacterium]|nr:hypothetical protein [Leptospiraceae bacterium]